MKIDLLPNHKLCKKCGLWKPFECFSVSSLKKDGLHNLCKECDSKYHNENRLARNKRNKKYRSDNRENLNAYKRNRRKENIQIRLKENLRQRIKEFLLGITATSFIERYLGCDWGYLRIHIEKQFTNGMSWDNYGNKDGQWSLDHIIPLSKMDMTNESDKMSINHYTNLQPLWHVDNVKKSNK